MFTICSKNQVRSRVKQVDATHLITMLDVGDYIVTPSRIDPENHLKLAFDDEENRFALRAPTIDHCRKILEFGAALPDDAVTVVHCFAGMCRSTAAGLALWIQKNGKDTVRARAWLAEDRPEAMPNMLMAQYFDDLLEMDGEFVRLCDEVSSHRILLVQRSPKW